MTTSERTFGLDLYLLARARKMSIILGLALSIVISTYWGPWMGLAWLVGIAWSLVNLHFIKFVVQRVITPDERNVGRIVLLMFVKFPVLYTVGFLLLQLGKLPVLGIVAGFTWPFLVLTFKGFGRFYMKLDERRNEPTV